MYNLFQINFSLTEMLVIVLVTILVLIIDSHLFVTDTL